MKFYELNIDVSLKYKLNHKSSLEVISKFLSSYFMKKGDKSHLENKFKYVFSNFTNPKDELKNLKIIQEYINIRNFYGNNNLKHDKLTTKKICERGINLLYFFLKDERQIYLDKLADVFEIKDKEFIKRLIIEIVILHQISENIVDEVSF